MKDVVDIPDRPLRLSVEEIECPRAISIKVMAVTSADYDDVLRFSLASRPFIRDILSDRIVVFGQLMTPTGVALLLRPSEHAADIAEIARLEVDFICAELARLRGTPPMRAHIITSAALPGADQGRAA